MGEGGAVFTNNDLLKQVIESYRDWGRDCYCAPGKDNTCGQRFCWKLAIYPMAMTTSTPIRTLAITSKLPTCRLLVHLRN